MLTIARTESPAAGTLVTHTEVDVAARALEWRVQSIDGVLLHEQGGSLSLKQERRAPHRRPAESQRLHLPRYHASASRRLELTPSMIRITVNTG